MALSSLWRRIGKPAVQLRSAAAVLVLLVSASGVGTLFWYMDWIYSLPTDVPKDYNSVETGSLMDLGDNPDSVSGKPMFLNFFNPRCACSRFNVPAIKALVADYGGRVSFSVVAMLPDDDDQYTEQDIQRMLGEEVPVSFDRSKATACGVYSTPQAVLIDAEGRLFYRGNYNKARYCSAEATNYARMAIEALLGGNAGLDFAALPSYGCSLPTCVK